MQVLDGYSAPITAGNFAANVRAGLYNGVPVNASYASVLAGAGRAPGARKHANIDDVFAMGSGLLCTAPATGKEYISAYWYRLLQLASMTLKGRTRQPLPEVHCIQVINPSHSFSDAAGRAVPEPYPNMLTLISGHL